MEKSNSKNIHLSNDPIEERPTITDADLKEQIKLLTEKGNFIFENRHKIYEHLRQKGFEGPFEDE